MIYHLGIRVIPFTHLTHLLKINKANKSAQRHRVAVVESFQVEAIATSVCLNKAEKFGPLVSNRNGPKVW